MPGHRSTSARLDFLRAIYLPRLAILPDGLWPGMDADRVFTALRSADPTQNSRFLEKLLNWTLRGELSASALARLRETLGLYGATRDTMPVGARDINRYRTVADFTDSVLAGPLARIRALIEADEARPRHEQVWRRTQLYKPEDSIEHKSALALSYILHNDPRGGRNLGHILRWFENPRDPLLPEDMIRVLDELLLYHRYRQRLAPERRDINDYRSWVTLQNAVMPYIKLPRFSAHELREIEDHAIDLNNAVAVAEGQGWRLLEIKTEDGAISLGRGTQFCTSFSGSRRNYFSAYKGDLLYLRDGKGDRYQIHFPSMQLRNTLDGKIEDQHAFIKSYPGLGAALAPYLLKLNHRKFFEWMDTQRYDFDGFHELCGVFTVDSAVIAAAARVIPEILLDCMVPKSKRGTGAMYAIDESGKEIGNMEIRLMAHLMMACRDVPAWRAAAENVIGRVVPRLMHEVADPEYNTYFILRLMNHYEGYPAWESVFRNALPATAAEARRRENGSYLRRLTEACTRNPRLFPPARPFTRDQALPAP